MRFWQTHCVFFYKPDIKVNTENLSILTISFDTLPSYREQIIQVIFKHLNTHIIHELFRPYKENEHISFRYEQRICDDVFMIIFKVNITRAQSHRTFDCKITLNKYIQKRHKKLR